MGRRVIAVAVVLGASVTNCIGSTAPATPSLYERGTATLRPIVGRPPRVLILGDSIADQFGSHSLFALRQMGIDAQLTAFWGWGLFTRDQYDMGEPIADPPPATLMYAAADGVDAFDPDVVAVYSNHNYWGATAPRDADGHPIKVGTAAWDEMVEEQLAALMDRLTVHGAVVYLVKPVSEPGESISDNAIWNSYLANRSASGFGIINTGDALAHDDGSYVAQLPDCAGEARDVHLPSSLHLSYYGAGLAGTFTAHALASMTGRAASAGAPAEPSVALIPWTSGYRVVTCDGASFAFGDVGSESGPALGRSRVPDDPVVAATKASSGDRALLLTAGGRVLPLGPVASRGDATGLGGSRRAVGIAPSARDEGYWIATSEGRVQAFGDAVELGDHRGQGQTVVAMAPTPDEHGYWLLTEEGRIVAFGTATHLGDLEGTLPAAPPIALVARPQSDGYWVLDRAGNVYPFGAARDQGSAAHQDMVRLVGSGYVTEPVPAWTEPTTAIAILPTPSGEGYWISLANGAVCHFGDAPPLGALDRAEVNPVMTVLGHEFYEEGSPCGQPPR
ncbi:MAG TPA: hypothetical protein VGJ86_21070 [Acidimicrobiales bacterium]